MAYERVIQHQRKLPVIRKQESIDSQLLSQSLFQSFVIGMTSALVMTTVRPTHGMTVLRLVTCDGQKCIFQVTGHFPELSHLNLSLDQPHQNTSQVVVEPLPNGYGPPSDSSMAASITGTALPISSAEASCTSTIRFC